jgi:hypothetical protein
VYLSLTLLAMVGRSRYAAGKKFKSGYTPKFAQFRANKQGRIP